MKYFISGSYKQLLLCLSVSGGRNLQWNLLLHFGWEVVSNHSDEQQYQNLNKWNIKGSWDIAPFAWQPPLLWMHIEILHPRHRNTKWIRDLAIFSIQWKSLTAEKFLSSQFNKHLILDLSGQFLHSLFHKHFLSAPSSACTSVHAGMLFKSVSGNGKRINKPQRLTCYRIAGIPFIFNTWVPLKLFLVNIFSKIP